MEQEDSVTRDRVKSFINMVGHDVWNRHPWNERRKVALMKTEGPYKEGTVQASVSGVEYLFKKNKIDVVRGTGAITAPGTISVRAEDGTSQTVEAKQIVIATGSESTPLPGVEIDEKRIVTSTGALALTRCRRGCWWLARA